MGNFQSYDVLIIGGGIFGVCASIELSKRNAHVGIINPDKIPHHLASSTDISKAVRMEYGSDVEYHRMAEQSILKWREWNKILPEEVYHEVGFLMLCKESIESEYQNFEKTSIQNLKHAGYKSVYLNALGIKEKYPFIDINNYPYASFNPVAGYAESGKAVHLLANYAKQNGVMIKEGESVEKLIIEDGICTGVKTSKGHTYHARQVLVAAGAHTPYLVPELAPYIRVTGHSIFWVVPSNKRLFSAPNFSVFTADISNTGWYGFPVHPETGVLKVGKHSKGETLNPISDDRIVKQDEIVEFRSFLSMTFPALAEAPLVYTRKCLYTDTLDGHFWIDQHPDIKRLYVCTGGSGHGFKMGPVVGEITADILEGKDHQFSQRYKWRHLTEDVAQQEEARDFLG